MYLENLYLSILQLFETRTFVDLFLNVDRLGNAICGGHYRFTISARVGYFVLYRSNRYWRFVRWIIDTTFYPLDGDHHCVMAFNWERKLAKNKPVLKYRRGNDVALLALSLVVVVSCSIIAPVLYLYSKLRFI